MKQYIEHINQCFKGYQKKLISLWTDFYFIYQKSQIKCHWLMMQKERSNARINYFTEITSTLFLSTAGLMAASTSYKILISDKGIRQNGGNNGHENPSNMHCQS